MIITIRQFVCTILSLNKTRTATGKLCVLQSFFFIVRGTGKAGPEIRDRRGRIMYTIKAGAEFDAAHFLKDYQGKCRNIHGHRWRVTAEVGSETLREDPQHRGMVDHSLIYETGSLKERTLEAFREEAFRLFELPFRPTAENFAKYFYDLLKQKGFAVRRTEVFETPDNCAAYEET